MNALRPLTAAMLLWTGCSRPDVDPDPPVPGTSKLGLADVSVLFPLPATPVDPGLLRLDAAGRGGPLLPRAVFDAIPVFNDNPLPERDHAHWRVVAARIDPCFPDLALLASNPGACRRQLRLVAQPLESGQATEPVGFQDNAIHLLYDLPQADFDAMARAWVAVRTARSSDLGRPLGVHVELAEQGLGGAVATELRRVVLAHAGAGTLSQVTFMEGRFAAWEFGGFRVQGGVHTPLAIPGLSADPATQTTVSDIDGIFDFMPRSPAGELLHALAGEPDNGPFGGTGGTRGKLTAPAPDILRALQESLDIDHPAKRNPDTVDCSACHAAGRARERADRLGSSSAGLEKFDGAGFNLSTEALGELRPRLVEQRALGYNGRSPVWNQRTVNESAAVAQALSDRLFGTTPPP